MSYLIKDTTREQREQIVNECIENVEAACDGCAPGLAEMYQPYIEGKMELRQINAAFRRGYTSGINGAQNDEYGCEWQR